MLTISAVILVLMADDWMTNGFGLNPWIAIPIAMLFMGLPYVLSDMLSYEPEDTIDDTPNVALNATREQLERKPFKSTGNLQDDNDHADEISRLEKEHFGDPDKRTGIYHSDNINRLPSKEDCTVTRMKPGLDYKI